MAGIEINERFEEAAGNLLYAIDRTTHPGGAKASP
jgi:hypothetical protein